LGRLQFWQGKRSHPHLRVPEEPRPGELESEAGEEECQLLLLYFVDGSFGDERDSHGLCCSTSNREEEELKKKVQKESKERLKGLRKKRAYFCVAYC
jgi:hypothetical protein